MLSPKCLLACSIAVPEPHLPLALQLNDKKRALVICCCLQQLQSPNRSGRR